MCVSLCVKSYYFSCQIHKIVEKNWVHDYKNAFKSIKHCNKFKEQGNYKDDDNNNEREFRWKLCLLLKLCLSTCHLGILIFFDIKYWDTNKIYKNNADPRIKQVLNIQCIFLKRKFTICIFLCLLALLKVTDINAKCSTLCRLLEGILPYFTDMNLLFLNDAWEDLVMVLFRSLVWLRYCPTLFKGCGCCQRVK